MIGATLGEAVERNIAPGDTVQVILGHSRWTAAAREMARQFWGCDAGLTLVMTSLGALGAFFFEGRAVSKVITTYSGDTFPTYGPNPIFQRAYECGDVEVEHWSILTLTQRLEAAARGLPAVTTGSIAGSSMEANNGFAEVDTPFGRVGLLSPLRPDVALVHGAAADRAGNVAISEPLLEGVWGAWAARRGVVATVEAIVDSLDGLGYRIRIPAHRVLDVVEAPFGAHPGGCFAPGLPVGSYGEDIPYWCDVAAAARGDFTDFARTWVLEPESHDAYLSLLGSDRLEWLRGRSDPTSWQADADEQPLDESEPPSSWEIAAALAAREVEGVVAGTGADAVLAGAGVANLAAWVAVARCRDRGQRVVLTAELGLFDYHPTPADPYIFNHRVFPGAAHLSDALTVLGMVIGGPGTTVVGCLGAAQIDRHGDINSTALGDDLTGGPGTMKISKFLVGSGGANDVASRARSCVVVTLAQPHRLPDMVDYVTAPGRSVESVVTNLGILRRLDGALRIAAVPPGEGDVASRVARFSGACGWTPEVSRTVEQLAPVEPSEVAALRNFDRRRLFLT